MFNFNSNQEIATIEIQYHFSHTRLQKRKITDNIHYWK